MSKVINIKDKKVTIYDEYDSKTELPIVFYNSFESDNKELWNQCKKFNCKDFILVIIENIKWDDEMTPYPIPSLFEGDKECKGKADEYISFLINEIVPRVKENIKAKPKYLALSGYSLGGLFSIYSMYKTDIFSRYVSGSGSFWYPNFLEFVTENNYLKKPEKIYFSLGNKEKNSKNVTLSTVENKTLKLVEHYRKLKVENIFEFNEGGHFKDNYLRIARGIK